MPVFCPRCGHQNRDGARFCGQCRTALVPVTPKNVPSSVPVSQPLTGMLPSNTFVHNRYMVKYKLGEGGMAAVYLAHDMNLQILCAIKEMSGMGIADPVERQQAISAFVQEAQLLATLSHPNIVRVIDRFEYTGKHYLVMEYVDGATLEDLLARQGYPFDEATVREWLRQLCDALGYLHRHNPPIIFRDLKPQNVMVNSQGQIKLIDFGIARRFAPGKKSDTTKLGTAGYAAPEQYGKGQTDARSDIYALGATMHRLLTGFDPSTSPINLPSVRQLNKQVSAETERLIMRSLETEAHKRWQSTDELELALGVMRPSVTTAPNLSALPPVVVGPKRPTTKLIQAVAKLTNRQLVTALSVILLTVIIGTWLLTPYLQRNLPVIWNNIPLFILAGPLAYAALRRTGIALISHVVMTLAVWTTIWTRIHMASVDYMAFLLGTVVSGIVIEGGFYYLYQSRASKRSQDAWIEEVAWFAGLSTLAVITFYLPWLSRFTLNVTMWAGAALMGAAAWFLGDLIREWLAKP